MPDNPHIQIILGSTREQRRGEPIARWLAKLASARGDLNAELVDLADFALPFLTQATPPMGPDSRDAAARDWASKIASADGYVLVVPEYNHGYPAAIKNALDHLFAEWNRKPMGFVSYGGASGGLRAVEQLRQVVIELSIVPLRRQIAIPRVWERISDSGELRAPQDPEAHLLLDDLVWWASALRAAREAPAAAAA
ncbi:MAG TPA: NAD(P)H-dependent oxidoreductase [Thermoleophilaceae bacterium]|nr:NAD(P)H-dependent oxidoreductase [Thermoleophilaceae bacterium]